MSDAVSVVPSPPSEHVRAKIRLSPALVRGALSVIGAAALWEIAGRTFLDNPLFFAPLSAVIQRMIALWSTGQLQTDIAVSLMEFGLGFLIGSAAGIFVGVMMASSKPLCEILDPWVSMLYATPFVAVAPLLTLWLGIGLAAHVAVIFLVVFFPVLINTYAGLANSDRDLIEVARSFGANKVQIFAKIRFPGALPFIVAGLRQGVARGLVGVVVAELFGSKEGLGHLILMSGYQFDPAGLFVGILIFALAGIGAVEAVRIVERRLAPWRESEGSL